MYAIQVRTQLCPSPTIRLLSWQGTVVHLTQHKTKESSTDSYSSDIGVQIHELLQSGLSQEDAAQHLFSDMRYATQETYYPFIASLFSLFSLDCHASRAGINYERWDAIIVDVNTQPYRN